MFQKPPELKLTTPCWKIIISVNSLIKKKSKKKPRKQKNYREWKEKCAKKELFCVFALSKQKILPGLNARTWLVCMFFNFLLSFIWPTVELLVHNRMHKFLLSFLTTMHNEDDSMRVIVADDENNNFHLQKQTANIT